MIPARDGVHLATDIYRPEGAGPFPVILERTPYDKSAPSRSEITAADPSAALARVARAVFHRCRLCRRLSGLPRALPLGRQLHQIPERGRRRVRHAGLAGAAALVQRAHRDDGPQLCGAYADGAGLPRPAGAGGAVPRLRRLLQRLSQRHQAWRRVRFEAGDLGLSQRARRRPRPGGQGGARSRGHRTVDGADAVAARRFAAEGRAGIRGVPVRAVVARGVRRFLETAGHLRRGLLRTLCRRADGASVGLVRPLRPHRDGELRGPCRGGPQSGAADPRAVDAWRPLAELCRRRRVRPRCDARRQPRRGFLRRRGGAGSTIGSRASTTASPPSRRCGCS